MNTIGLLPILDLLADHSYWVTIAICLCISPIALFIIGLIGESRLVPVNPRKQFLSFFPGDFFMSWGVANGLYIAQGLPNVSAWYNNWAWHLVVLVGAITVATLMTKSELNPDTNNPYKYKRRAVFSPTKLYHNFALYGLFGYTAVSTYIACVAGGMGWITLLAVTPFIPWFIFLFTEGKASDLTRKQRVICAHVADWKPIWKK